MVAITNFIESYITTLNRTTAVKYLEPKREIRKDSKNRSKIHHDVFSTNWQDKEVMGEGLPCRNTNKN